MSQLTFFAEEPPASPSASQDSERDWLTRVATSCLPTVPLLQSIGPGGWFGRTSPEFCLPTEDGTLAPSSGSWANSGMGTPTGFLTLSTSEFHSGAAVCSLSDVLETGDVPQRYFLSARACRGYLRRLAKIQSQMSIGGLVKVEFLIASMQAMAQSGEATSGTPAAM